MAVFTEVTPQQAAALLESLGLGELRSMQGCAGGIENTNYFVTTQQGEYVLTLFERLSFEQLPFYLAAHEAPGPARHPGARPGRRRAGGVSCTH
jgi:homoserine kinase type II